MTEARALHMLVRDFHYQLGPERLMRAGNRLGHDPVEARAFKAREPIRCDTWFTCCRSQMDWWHRTGQQRLQLFAPMLERFAPPIAVSLGQEVEKDDRCRT